MTIVLILASIISFVFFVAPLLLALQFIQTATKTMNQTSALTNFPFVSVIIKAKGTDPEFEEALESLSHQDYPNYEVVGATVDEEDSAFKVLHDWKQKHPEIKIRLITSGKATRGAQSAYQTVKAVDQTTPESEILLFLDSDALWHRNTLRYMVGALEQNPQVGCATGYRWQTPVKGNFSSYVCSAWNAGTMVFLTSDRWNHPWGGCFMIRKKFYEENHINELWSCTLSDDHTITSIIKNQGLKIKFVPECLAPSSENISWDKYLKFSRRQSMIIKYYNPKLYQASFFNYGFTYLFFIFGIAVLLTGASNAVFALLLSLPFLSQPVLLAMLRPTVKRMLSYHNRPFPAIGSLDMLAAPIASAVFLWGIMTSLGKNMIEWRGIKYILRSPTEIEIL